MKLGPTSVSHPECFNTSHQHKKQKKHVSFKDARPSAQKAITTKLKASCLNSNLRTEQIPEPLHNTQLYIPQVPWGDIIFSDAFLQDSRY